MLVVDRAQHVGGAPAGRRRRCARTARCASSPSCASSRDGRRRSRRSRGSPARRSPGWTSRRAASTRRAAAASSPLAIRPRRIWSSHGAVPAATSAARRALTVWGAVAMSVLSCSQPVRGRRSTTAATCEAEVRVDVRPRGRTRRTSVIPIDGPVARRPSGPSRAGWPPRPRRAACRAGRARASRSAARCALEAVHARHADDARGDAPPRPARSRGAEAQRDLGAGADQDHVRARAAAVAQHVGAALDRVVGDRAPGRAPAATGARARAPSGVSVARSAKLQASAVSCASAGRTTLMFGVARSVASCSIGWCVGPSSPTPDRVVRVDEDRRQLASARRAGPRPSCSRRRSGRSRRRRAARRARGR